MLRILNIDMKIKYFVKRLYKIRKQNIIRRYFID